MKLVNNILPNNSTHQSDKDAELIRRICDSDEKALELLYHQYYGRLFRFVSRITWRQEVIEEVINEVMYTVWKKAATYNHQCQPSTWIFGIAYNKSRHASANSGNAEIESLDAVDLDQLFLEEPYSELERVENHDWIESALETLSIDQRTVIELTYFQGLHYSEIATLMDCPENTVKTRMHHARKKMALALNQTLYDAPK